MPQTFEIERVSVSSSGEQADAGSYTVSFFALGSYYEELSADGRFVLFLSEASNLVDGDTNGQRDLFIRDLQQGTTERVNVSSSGEQANELLRYGEISDDGRYVLFWSEASNLVDGDTNGQTDLFIRDLQQVTTERVSVSSSGEQANGRSSEGELSVDARHVLFSSDASNLVDGDTNGQRDLFIRDLQQGTTERVNVSSSGEQANGRSSDGELSADGRYVLFTSHASNLVDGDTNGQADLFIRDLQQGTTERVNVSSSGEQGNGFSFDADISADGRYVLLYSVSSNLVDGDTNGLADLFVRDLQQGTTERVSVSSSGEQGNGSSSNGDISADGRYVLFWSEASNLVDGDTNSQRDLFIRDLQQGTTERVNVSSSGEQANALSVYGEMSDDGQYVLFWSAASNLVDGDTNGRRDFFIRALQQGTTERVNVSSSGEQVNVDSFYGRLSEDGRYILFSSTASNLVSGDTNGTSDVFRVTNPLWDGEVLSDVEDISLLTPISSGYEVSVTQAPGAPSHQGDLYSAWDFALAGVPTFGAPVTAVAAGRVVFVHAGVLDGGAFSQNTTPRDPSLGPAGGLGNVVTLEHTVGGTRFYSSYVHLRDNATIEDLEARWIASQSGGPDVLVAAGDVIGAIGNTGFREGTHLHLNLGSSFGNFVNGAGQSFPAYQIAKGPVGDPILDQIRFVDSSSSDGLLAAGDRYISGGGSILDDGPTNTSPEIRGETTVWFSSSEERTADTMIEVTDPDGLDDISFVRFWDATPGTDGGFLTIGGERVVGTNLDVSFQELSQVAYLAGNQSGNNRIVVETFDKSGGSSGDFTMEFIVDAPDNTSRAPSIVDSGSDVLAAGSSTRLDALFRVSDPDGADDLQSFRLIDDGGAVGGFVLNGEALGSNSGWLNYSDFSSVSYVSQPSLGHDAVTLQVRDASGNETSSERVLEIRQTGAVASSERITFQELTQADTRLFSETDWEELTAHGTELLVSFLDSLAILGDWELDRLLANGIDITSGVNVRTFVANSDSFSVSDIAQLNFNTELVAGLGALASYSRAGVDVLNGGSANSALFAAHSDVILGFASGIAGKVATAGLAKGLVAAGIVGAGAPVILVAAGGAVVAIGTNWALNRYFPETAEDLVDVVSAAPSNFMDLFLDATPFFAGGGGDESVNEIGTASIGFDDAWSLNLEDGSQTSLAELQPGLANLTAERLGLGGAIATNGFQFLADVNNQGFSDALIGSRADDTLIGGSGGDVIFAVAGNNLLIGQSGDDQILGGDNQDTISGGVGNDTLDGGDGDDNISASDGDDIVFGGLGNDSIGGGLGNDNIDGGEGDDIMGGGFGDDSVSGGLGNDVVAGGADDDALSGGDGNDSMSGSFGNDLIDAGSGADDIGGGTGRDTIDAGTGNDRVGGGEGNDSILGDAGNDFLAGGGRNDTIDGGTGNDTINGGAGNDQITGGLGTDQFVFASFFNGEADIITDFEDGIDSFFIRRNDPDTGVENINNGGNGLAGFVAAMNILDTAAGAQMSVNGNTILVEGITAAQLTVDDFQFL